MTLYDRPQHSPAEHFAAAGYAHITSRAEGAIQPVEDELAALERASDDYVLRILRGPEKPGKRRERIGEDKIIPFAGEWIDWPVYLPGLKVWAGRASIGTLVQQRVRLLWEHELPADIRLMEWRLPLKTVSGIDPRTNTAQLDVGFSVALLGMEIMTYVAAELLAVVGMQITPLIRLARDRYGYDDPFGRRWSFMIADRSGYHRQYSMSTPEKK